MRKANIKNLGAGIKKINQLSVCLPAEISPDEARETLVHIANMQDFIKGFEEYFNDDQPNAGPSLSKLMDMAQQIPLVKVSP